MRQSAACTATYEFKCVGNEFKCVDNELKSVSNDFECVRKLATGMRVCIRI